jgi:RNA polymerase sigma-70 factor (ECF subfamily)
MLGRLHRNRREFEELALPHVDSLYGTAVRLTRNERDAEDLVQDALLKAFRFFHRFEPGTNVKAWLFKILTNTFANRYRKRQRERSILEAVQAEPAVPLVSDQAHAESRDPESVLLSRLVSDHVKTALESVPEEFRLAVILADLEDFSYREIADIMDCPIGTVMSRIYRGRRMLQNQLRDYAREQGLLAAQPASDSDAAPAAGTGEGPRLSLVKSKE